MPPDPEPFGPAESPGFREASSGTAEFTPPSVQLPRGGGALRGIGEKFSTNSVTGTSSLKVPIAVSSGRSGFGPQLTLDYDSGAGNGPFGFGWRLGLPAITRKTDKGLPRYRDAEESDVYLLSSVEDLVPLPDDIILRGFAVRRYRPRIEGLFARIERWTRLDNGEIHWRSISRGNVTTRYGSASSSRIADPDDPAGRVFSWLISESYDARGNAIVYEYIAENDRNVDQTQASEQHRVRSANRYLKTIKYGNSVPLYDPGTPASGQEPPRSDTPLTWHFEVVFDYGHSIYTAEDDRHVLVARSNADPDWPVRPDPFSSYRPGFEVRTYRRCQRVLMFHDFAELGSQPCLARSTDFDYADLDYSRPVSPQTEAAHDGSTRLASFLRTVTQAGYVRDPGAPIQHQGDRDYVRYLCRTLPAVEFAYSKAVIDPTVRELEAVPAGEGVQSYQWLDLDGEGAPGLLSRSPDAWYYQANLGAGHFGVPRTLAAQPTLADVQLLDIAGNGQLDAVTFTGAIPGFYERTREQSWTALRPFGQLPRIDWDDPDLRLADLTGDGLADVLITAGHEFCWHQSLGGQGFGASERTVRPFDEESGPWLLSADREEAIYLADMSGDGLSDLVRIRNGEVCYWPNLGYARFGAKVTMDRAPWFDHPDLFDQQRVRLADIDGSGTTDLIFLGRGGPTIYANQCGNSFRDPVVLPGPNGNDDISSVAVADVLAKGTACLVWSSALEGYASRPFRYIDLMSGGKPHLLVRSVNKLGTETHIEYATSTQFYLADRAAGRPQLGRIAFPVHVVERMQVYDRIGDSRHVTRYAYHDGYFDGAEREFRGFGLVERWDTESFAALSASGGPVGSNADRASHVPPTLTRMRYHLGRASDGGVLPGGLSPDEQREAYRALKGSLLHQAVYARDDTEYQDLPYTASDNDFAVRLVQAKGRNRHAVFFTYDLNSIDSNYERRPQDPRIRHKLTLDVDDFGNVLRYANAGYGRQFPDERLDPQDRAVQALDLIVYTENEVTNAVDTDDAHRVPQPAASRTYELTGIRRQPGERLIAQQVREAVSNAAFRPYQQPPTAGQVERRLIEHLRSLYRRDDLAGPLPPGRLEPLALPYQQYRLAFTPDLVTAVYGDRVTDGMLAAEGRYVWSDGAWWLPSGRVFYSADPGDSAATELSYARAHFFLPHRYRSPFDSDTTISYEYDLLISEICDALENRTTVGERQTDPSQPLVRGGNDYRVLQPRLIMDPNRNLSEVVFDGLGLVAGTAVMGAPELDPRPGDRLSPMFSADLTQAEIDRFLANPLGPAAAELLADATSRVVYDLNASPVFAATITRETHVSDLQTAEPSRLQITFSYSDGFGREIQKKVQAEPGMSAGPRWVGTGWTIFNNKGDPVRRYEPFFTSTHQFERDARLGVSVILCYDPVRRVVATLHPNHAWEKVDFDPWGQLTWDATDTVLADPRSDPVVGGLFAKLDENDFQPTWYARRVSGELGSYELAAAVKAAAHAATPAQAHADALGRAFLTVAHNRAGDANEFLHTKVTLDVENKQREVRDPAGRTVMRYDYSVAGSRIHQASMEAGERWLLPDVAGQPIYQWDSRGQQTRKVYDALRRPARQFLRQGTGPEVLTEYTVYGESQPDAEARNLRTRVVEVYDQAGLAVSDQYDFKGNQVRTARQLAASYHTVLDWSRTVPMEPESYVAMTRFDARNRTVEITEPDGTIIHPSFNEANLLDRLEARLGGAAEITTFVAGIDYNAKGQRTQIRYGNGTSTTYERDPDTFRLIRLRTIRPGSELQDLSYVYDPVGNVTHTQDDAGQTIFFRGNRADPSADYSYDAIYRLTEATGREHLGQLSGPSDPYAAFDQGRGLILQAEDGQAMARYVEQYTYDAVGNLSSLRHRSTDPAGPVWTRQFSYEEPSLIEPSKSGNRLTRTVTGSATEVFSQAADGYDPHGNMLHLPHLTQLAWDFRDQLRMSAAAAGSAAGQRTWYVYDSAGTRVRKVTERPDGSLKEERIYIGGFEVYRTAEVTRQTVHIMDDDQRVALIETRTDGQDPAPALLIRYQLADRLGSVSLEVDESARIISYEEYSPYGSTTLQAVRSSTETPKRYRFTSRERDEQTGFSYHGARYYAPWLARWVSCDPAGLTDGPNVYCYVSCRPTRSADPAGTQGTSQDLALGMMWDRMGQELSGMIESMIGGHAHVSPRTNTVVYNGPEGGVGGAAGGVVRAGTLRAVPIERNPTEASLAGMEVGASLVPVADPAARLATGETVTRQEASRGWAAFNLVLDLVPWAMEAHGLIAEARGVRAESRLAETAGRVEAGGAAVDTTHVGSSGSKLEPTVTNPSTRDDLCVADVGAHEANLRNPNGPPITNTDFVEAAGRPVSKTDAPIGGHAEAVDFLNSGFEGLHEQGRISEPITVESAPAHLEPGNYVATVQGPQGGHALHATVIDEGVEYLSKGRIVSEETAKEIAEEGGLVLTRTKTRVEYFDPQKGYKVNLAPGTKATFSRLR